MYRGGVDNAFFGVLRECADEIGSAIVNHRGRGYSGQRPSQYHLDVVADEVAVRVLRAAGLRIVSEESGVTGAGEWTVVVDPIDGSTNCDRGIPFYATSFALLRGEELVAGLVKNQATGTVYEAEKGSGAFRNGEAIHAGDISQITAAIISFSGRPDRHLGWAQHRSLGAASLEICLVADGSLDAFAVAQQSALHPWDYLGALIISREAGAVAGDYFGDDLETSAFIERHPVVAGTRELLDAMIDAGPL